jgi:hypothetical protein
MSLAGRASLWVICRLTGIPYANMCTKAEYCQQVEAAGFKVSDCRVVAGVLGGFAAFARRHHEKVGRHVVASKWSRFKHAASLFTWVEKQGLIDFCLFVATKQ